MILTRVGRSHRNGLPSAGKAARLSYFARGSGVQTGTVEIREGAHSGTMSVNLGDTPASCDGRFQYASRLSGTWELDCGGGLTARGRFTALGVGKGARGQGDDSEGRKVQFILGVEGNG